MASRLRDPRAINADFDKKMDQSTNPEVQAILDYGYRKVFTVQKQIDDLLDQLPTHIDKKMQEHDAFLKHMYNPKLKLAKEKVGFLEDVVEDKRVERENQKQLITVKNQIQHFEETLDDLKKRHVKYSDETFEYKNRCSGLKEDIADVSEQLLQINKKNLQDTYVLENMQDEYDRLRRTREKNSMFMTSHMEHSASKSDQFLEKGSGGDGFLSHQQSYATLEQQNPKDTQHTFNVIQKKIDKVLGEENRRNNKNNQG